ncbi:hypothetical protein PTSG_05574 [Salpingoeca rosetta]|uniref:Uncharacterized protein n=1 Tax=Salpingoeca rosetta (strain ATCC 50818 / BSB-021) TaxID=946362 RepID=F2UBL3_SALR5|nr:uncharacterized protein PTSG_05574 [Salpingoeca rosetta]EGD73879.1 hypothetical protein PTSG_05574 [Salpingoeca rosetta]|eukprot:XP_004993442.1 hypothetical protein PTSG_05574 [Salpingoeca rosetta]
MPPRRSRRGNKGGRKAAKKKAIADKGSSSSDSSKTAGDDAQGVHALSIDAWSLIARHLTKESFPPDGMSPDVIALMRLMFTCRFLYDELPWAMPKWWFGRKFAHRLICSWIRPAVPSHLTISMDADGFPTIITPTTTTSKEAAEAAEAWEAGRFLAYSRLGVWWGCSHHMFSRMAQESEFRRKFALFGRVGFSDVVDIKAWVNNPRLMALDPPPSSDTSSGAKSRAITAPRPSPLRPAEITVHAKCMCDQASDVHFLSFLLQALGDPGCGKLDLGIGSSGSQPHAPFGKLERFSMRNAHNLCITSSEPIDHLDLDNVTTFKWTSPQAQAEIKGSFRHVNEVSIRGYASDRRTISDISALAGVPNVSFEFITSLPDLTPLQHAQRVSLDHVGLKSLAPLKDVPHLDIRACDVAAFEAFSFTGDRLDLSFVHQVTVIHAQNATCVNVRSCNRMGRVVLGSKKLDTLTVRNCELLSSVELPNAQSARKVGISECEALKEIAFADMALLSLDIYTCASLASVQLQQLHSFDTICISNCTGLIDFGVHATGDVGRLELSVCRALRNVHIHAEQDASAVVCHACGFTEFTCEASRLHELHIGSCPNIAALHIPHLHGLRDLHVHDCDAVTAIGVPGCNLTRLTADACPKLASLEVLSAKGRARRSTPRAKKAKLTAASSGLKLARFIIDRCPELTAMPAVASAQELRLGCPLTTPFLESCLPHVTNITLTGAATANVVGLLHLVPAGAKVLLLDMKASDITCTLPACVHTVSAKVSGPFDASRLANADYITLSSTSETKHAITGLSSVTGIADVTLRSCQLQKGDSLIDCVSVELTDCEGAIRVDDADSLVVTDTCPSLTLTGIDDVHMEVDEVRVDFTRRVSSLEVYGGRIEDFAGLSGVNSLALREVHFTNVDSMPYFDTLTVEDCTGKPRPQGRSAAQADDRQSPWPDLHCHSKPPSVVQRRLNGTMLHGMTAAEAYYDVMEHPDSDDDFAYHGDDDVWF